MTTPAKETVHIKVDKHGRKYIELPYWAWVILHKKSGIKSSKARHVKKAVKRMFTEFLWQALTEHALSIEEKVVASDV